MENNSIILIDAYAQIYRGFYAIRHLSNSAGEPTNAMYAIAKFLLRMHDEHPSRHGAVVFDMGRETFRMELAPDYKANRKPMPDELRSQIPMIREVMQLFGWDIFEQQGVEADDVLAAMAQYFSPNKVQIVSADKDIAQVTTELITMLIPDRKNGGLIEQGLAEVEARFNVRADQIIDYLSLLGDSSDNIPGLPGVGAKTAVKLLDQFGSIENMIANSAEIKNAKLKAKVDENHGRLKLNCQLITLKTDLPTDGWETLDKIERREPDWLGLVEFARKWELKSLLAMFEARVPKQVLEEVEDGDVMPEIGPNDVEVDLFSFDTSAPAVEEKKTDPKPDATGEAYVPDLFDL